MTVDKREPNGWHLKKEVQVGHLISSVGMFVGALLYVGEIKKDVEVLKVQAIKQEKLDDRQDREARDTAALLREQLKAIDGKLDRLIEGGSGRR